jgi:hypothetical protein
MAEPLTGLPEGAYLTIIGPTLTPARRWAACIMDHPAEYASRTLSWGFDPNDPIAAARDAIRNLATYEQQTWPYRNDAIDRAEQHAAPQSEAVAPETLRAWEIDRLAELRREWRASHISYERVCIEGIDMLRVVVTAPDPKQEADARLAFLVSPSATVQTRLATQKPEPDPLDVNDPAGNAGR